MKSTCKVNHRLNLCKITEVVLLCILAILVSSCRQIIVPIPPFWEDGEDSTETGKWNEYFPEGNGSVSNPYIISDQAGIEQIARLVNDGMTTFEGIVFQVENPITLTNHNPIGTKGPSAFQGTFRGPSPENKTKISISYEDDINTFVGIFGGLGTGALIENIEVSGNINNKKITPENHSTPSAGLIAGNMQDGAVIQNCEVSGSVKAQRAGGIAGEMEGGSILHCVNNATVLGLDAPDEGGTYAGGIIGSAAEGHCRIEFCINQGAVSSETGSTTGGIVGSAENGTYIYECDNNGSIKGKIRSGGIAGTLTDSTIENCINLKSIDAFTEGTYTNSGIIGGLVGRASNSSIINSSNEGNLEFSGYSNIGGIAGTASNTSISETTNKGNITGDFIVGGIVGTADNGTNISGTTDTDTNVGSVSGISYHIGGIAGRLKGATISNVINSGDIKGTERAYQIGGLVGCAYTGSSIISSWNHGAVTITHNSNTTYAAPGGIVGILQNSEIKNGGSTGKVSTNACSASAIAGILKDEEEFAKSIISGVVINGDISSNYPGGAIGYLQSSGATLQGLTFTDDLKIENIDKIIGKIIGLVAAPQSITIENCYINDNKISDDNPITKEHIGSGISYLTITYL